MVQYLEKENKQDKKERRSKLIIVSVGKKEKLKLIFIRVLRERERKEQFTDSPNKQFSTIYNLENWDPSFELKSKNSKRAGSFGLHEKS